MTAFRILLIVLYVVLTIFVFGYIDYSVLTPMLPLPEDICYYHENIAPTWVRLFYLDSLGHTEPPFSGLHIMTLVLASLITATYLAFKTDKWLKIRTQKTND